MKVSIKNNAQGGFTLIELIVVIVILGILAATALPKFASLGGDARVASLNAAKGSLAATSAMAHGKWLANTSSTPLSSFNAEGVTVSLTSNGYPTAAQTTADAAGLTNSDYQVYLPGSTGTNQPSPDGNSIAIVPKSLVGTTNATKCYLLYTVTTTTAPSISLPSTATPDNCT